MTTIESRGESQAVRLIFTCRFSARIYEPGWYFEIANNRNLDLSIGYSLRYYTTVRL